MTIFKKKKITHQPLVSGTGGLNACVESSVLVKLDEDTIDVFPECTGIRILVYRDGRVRGLFLHGTLSLVCLTRYPL